MSAENLVVLSGLEDSCRSSISQPGDFDDVAWAQLEYTREEVDAAGNLIRDLMAADLELEGDKLDKALLVINNWRSSHSFPLNTFQVGLRDRARGVYRDALVAQRIKRLSSIVEKLERLRRLQLTDIQDIGGCRAVVGSVAQVRRL